MSSGRKRHLKSTRKSTRRRASRYMLSDYRRYPAPIQRTPRSQIVIQLRNYFLGTTNGSGVFAAVIPCDPSATLSATFGSTALFPEWSDWLALFGSVKCIQLEVKLHSATTDEVKGDVNRGLIMAGNLQNVTVPSNYTSVADNADSQSWNVLQDTTPTGRYHAIRHSRSLEWAAASLPVPSNSNYIGCPGGIAFYGDTMPANLTICTVHVVGTYKLMNRT